MSEAVQARPPKAVAAARTSGLTSAQILSIATAAYLIFFFAYMFLPLGIMVAAAFNANPNPSIAPWKGFTLQWFVRLVEKDELWEALTNSLIIGAAVVVLSVLLGLAGALLLTNLHARAKSFFYALMVSPVLTPGVILGVSAILMWQEIGIEGGLFVTIVAQTTFIAAYAMLLFMARLQRFDATLEEAALDLGATPRQVFWFITLPFLRPTILTAAVLAFLQSFENYNTTLFSIGREMTLTIFIGSAVKQGQEPTINALAVVFISLTIVMAIAYEIKRRTERTHMEAQREAAKRIDRTIAGGGADPATAET
ncbi:MAG: ABC transporter permease [Alphaproteobacteria bacterium]|nr:MAG: ABC transporter permease [Alphaproteobacteria bacterium]